MSRLIPINWQYDGWTAQDWTAVEFLTRELRDVTQSLDDAIGNGGGGFVPSELAGLARHAAAVSAKLADIAQGYVS